MDCASWPYETLLNRVEVMPKQYWFHLLFFFSDTRHVRYNRSSLGLRVCVFLAVRINFTDENPGLCRQRMFAAAAIAMHERQTGIELLYRPPRQPAFR